MKGTEQNTINLDAKEKERTIRIFTDPIKLLLLYKIIMNPGISSRQLKEELKLKGTKIYYYLSDFEGLHPKTKERMNKPLVRIEKEETINHLIMKKYYPTDYMYELGAKNAMFNLFEDPRKNTKWNYSLLINVGIALLENHLREVEKKPLEDFENGIPFLDTLTLNKLDFTHRSFYESKKEFLKNFFHSINSENQNKTLLQLISETSPIFIVMGIL